MRKIAVVTGCLALALGSSSATEIDPNAKVLPDASACAPGFVHRLARVIDRVCAPPQAHKRTVQENKDAPLHIDPKGAYGPNSCKSGYVWREAFEGDLVCVTPAIRGIVQEENLLGPARLLASKSIVIDVDDADAAPTPTGPWLCGEETTASFPTRRSGHVIDRQGRVWGYGYGRESAKASYRWQEKNSSIATAEELSKRFAGATPTGKSIALEEIQTHLPLIDQAGKVTPIAGKRPVELMLPSTTVLYCLVQDDATGAYREVLLDQQGLQPRVNESPAARQLITWFQPYFWIID